MEPGPLPQFRAPALRRGPARTHRRQRRQLPQPGEVGRHQLGVHPGHVAQLARTTRGPCGSASGLSGSLRRGPLARVLRRARDHDVLRCDALAQRVVTAMPQQPRVVERLGAVHHREREQVGDDQATLSEPRRPCPPPSVRSRVDRPDTAPVHHRHSLPGAVVSLSRYRASTTASPNADPSDASPASSSRRAATAPPAQVTLPTARAGLELRVDGVRSRSPGLLRQQPEVTGRHIARPSGHPGCRVERLGLCTVAAARHDQCDSPRASSFSPRTPTVNQPSAPASEPTRSRGLPRSCVRRTLTSRHTSCTLGPWVTRSAGLELPV